MAIADGIPFKSLKDELLSLEAGREELGRMLAFPASSPPLLHPNLGRWRRSTPHSRPEGGDGILETVRRLINEIVPTPEDGRLRVDLRGELAGIPALGRESQEPGRDGRALAQQIKLVAGARNCLYLLLFAGGLARRNQ